MVSHNPSSNIDNLCENIVANVDLSRFTYVNFDKLWSEDKNKVQEAIYEMMATFTTIPLDFSNSLP